MSAFGTRLDRSQLHMRGNQGFTPSDPRSCLSIPASHSLIRVSKFREVTIKGSSNVIVLGDGVRVTEAMISSPTLHSISTSGG